MWIWSAAFQSGGGCCDFGTGALLSGNDEWNNNTYSRDFCVYAHVNGKGASFAQQTAFSRFSVAQVESTLVIRLKNGNALPKRPVSLPTSIRNWSICQANRWSRSSSMRSSQRVCMWLWKTGTSIHNRASLMDVENRHHSQQQ